MHSAAFQPRQRCVLKCSRKRGQRIGGSLGLLTVPVVTRARAATRIGGKRVGCSGRPCRSGTTSLG